MGPVADTGSSPGLPISLDTNGTATPGGGNVVGGAGGSGAVSNPDTNNGQSSQTTNNNNANPNPHHNNNHTGSPVDQSSLIVLQPSGTAGGYSSMLPSFSHYATGKWIYF